MLLADKVVIVTGAAGGLGAGIARVCYREGAAVIVADVRDEAGRAMAQSLGERAQFIHCNVSVNDDLQNLVNATLDRHGRLDGVVNNAGINYSRPFLEITEADWERVIDINLRGAFFLTQFAIRQMLAQSPRGGSIVNISSVHSIAAVHGASPYDASKCGMVGFSKSVALEFANQGIRVNCISPGLINTDIWREVQAAAPSVEECVAHWNANIPIERVIEPEEIGEVAAFLLSDRSSCMTGSNVVADGGLTSQLTSKEPYGIRPV
jgi:NAD(P)-dependent dehydrogenase (short-subunit alcohol dehydrogenase family)